MESAQRDKGIMDLKTAKRKMLEWTDFWGGEIIYTDEIIKSKTKKDLEIVFDKYIAHIEQIGMDAVSHANKFKNELRLTQ